MQAYSMPCCGSVGGCGVRAVSRKTPIYFIYLIQRLNITKVAIRTSKLSNSWPVFKFGSDSLWPRMSRAPFEDSKTSGQRLEKLKSNLARLNIKLIWVQIQFKRSEHRPNLWEERHARLWDWIAKRHEMWEAGWETQHSFTFSTPSSNAPSCGPTRARSCCNLTFFERNADEVFLTTSKRSTCFEYYSPR